MKQILVTGGAGYIGSLVVKKLLDAEHGVVVIDNLSKGKKALVDKRAKLYVVDILDRSTLTKKLKGQTFDVVMHLAARKDAGESMVNPDLYYENIVGIMNLIALAPVLKVKKFIFSSSAAVYGEPVGDSSISEAHICQPTNFYGYSKLAGEELLEWMRRLHKIDYIALRYFNVAGDGGLHYIDPNAKNIFNVIADVLVGKKKQLEIFGDDYPTPDGTGIRDYVHVSDIADAHIRALSTKGSHVINLGSETGYSVQEIVQEFEKVSGKKVARKIVRRRAGDIASLIATSAKATEILKWKPTRGLEEMVVSTWEAYNK